LNSKYNCLSTCPLLPNRQTVEKSRARCISTPTRPTRHLSPALAIAQFSLAIYFPALFKVSKEANCQGNIKVRPRLISNYISLQSQVGSAQDRPSEVPLPSPEETFALSPKFPMGYHIPISSISTNPVRDKAR
jgi:hypothetical protein